MMAVRRAQTPEDLEKIRELFTEYIAGLGVDLTFDEYTRELATLPGAYAPPTGCLLLGEANGEIAGCVGGRLIALGVYEMRRLYVRPAFRGQGIGQALVEAIIAEARQGGYTRIRLDSLPTMHAAHKLYRSFGFRDIQAYRYNPIPGAIFLELDLNAAGYK